MLGALQGCSQSTRSHVAPIGRLLRRVRTTKPWRTLPPLLFTEHLTTSTSTKAWPISASGGGGMRQAMGLHALEMLHVLDGAPCPEPANEREAWKKANMLWKY